MMLAASNDGIGSCPNGIADAERLAEALEHGEDESTATVLTFGYPEKPRRDPESQSPEDWVQQRRPQAVRGDRQGALSAGRRVCRPCDECEMSRAVAVTRRARLRGDGGGGP